MRLNKLNLNKVVKTELVNLGFCEVKDSTTGAQGLYIKYLENNLFLTLGLIISRFEKNEFTASFYLSKTTRWGSIWGDIPLNSYIRINHLLNINQKKNYFSIDMNNNIINEGWWSFNDKNTLGKFIEAVHFGEQKLISDAKLKLEIDRSLELNELLKAGKLVIELVTSGIQLDSANYKFVPLNIIDDTPIVWFKAAEEIIIKTKIPINKNTVKELAIDAFRINRFGK